MTRKSAPLASSFVPENYEVVVSGGKQLSGHVVIVGRKIGRPSKRITLHQSSIKVTDAHLNMQDRKGDKAVTVKRINHLSARNQVRLHTTATIYPGSYRISLDYVTHSTPAQAVDLSFSKGSNRRLFPCIDEPEAAAEVKLIANK